MLATMNFRPEKSSIFWRIVLLQVAVINKTGIVVREAEPQDCNFKNR
jgi:hypothetical protein